MSPKTVEVVVRTYPKMMVFRTTEAGDYFIKAQAARLNTTRTAVVRAMLVYAANHMTAEDWAQAEPNEVGL